MSPEFYWIAVAVVTVLSAARLTRLATWDKFPPVLAVRNAYADWTDKTERRRGWQVLAFCGYCFSFWATLAVVVWASLAGVLDGESNEWTRAWWIGNGILAASYAAAVFMANDGDDGEES